LLLAYATIGWLISISDREALLYRNMLPIPASDFTALGDFIIISQDGSGQIVGPSNVCKVPAGIETTTEEVTVFHASQRMLSKLFPLTRLSVSFRSQAIAITYMNKVLNSASLEGNTTCEEALNRLVGLGCLRVVLGIATVANSPKGAFVSSCQLLNFDKGQKAELPDDARALDSIFRVSSVERRWINWSKGSVTVQLKQVILPSPSP
jgi:hypothetical protein